MGEIKSDNKKSFWQSVHWKKNAILGATMLVDPVIPILSPHVCAPLLYSFGCNSSTIIEKQQGSSIKK